MIQVITPKETVLYAAIEKMEATNKELLEALKDTAQTLAWMAFGECRGISKNLLMANESVTKAKAAIASATKGEAK